MSPLHGALHYIPPCLTAVKLEPRQCRHDIGYKLPIHFLITSRLTAPFHVIAPDWVMYCLMNVWHQSHLVAELDQWSVVLNMSESIASLLPLGYT